MPNRLRPAVPGLAALACAGLLAFPATGAPPERQRPELPAEVQEWLERDQLQRWANMIRTGRELYTEGSCSRCHAEDATGGERAPDLTDDEWVQSDGSLEGIRETIFWGVRRRDFADPERPFEMNPAGGMQLEWEEVRALAAYVWSLSNGDFLPGR